MNAIKKTPLPRAGDGGYVVGVDIGGTNSVVGLVNGGGEIVARHRFATQAEMPAELFAERLAAVVNELVGRLPQGSVVRAMVVASPAANPHDGVVDNPANLNWGRVNLVDLMKGSFRWPIAIMNDSGAAALGEVRFGVAQGLSNILLITLGTGLGAGIIIDGKLVQGTNGAAGEFGHMTLEPGGRDCTCGRQGCVETYVSATGVRRTVFELLAQRVEPTALRALSFNDLTAEKIADFAARGDGIACAAFERTGIALGRMIANIVAAFDPEAVVLSGGLVNAGDLLVGPARRSFEKHVLHRYRSKVRILVSTLNEGQAAILGASCFARDILLGNSHDQ